MGRLSLKVVPGSSRDEVVGWLGDSLKVKAKAPPEKGRANDAVVALLADRLGIDPSSIAVLSGHGSPAKVVAIDGIDDEAIRQAFPREKPGKTSGVRNRE
jgi:uncharacterized protein